MAEKDSNKTKLLTPFNIIVTVILLVGLVLAIIRFVFGLASISNGSDDYPWGLLIGFNVMAGVALSAGGFVIGTAVYIFGMKEYKLVVRQAILTGFLGYFFVVVALFFDLGRPWRLPYPIVVSYGVTSVLFLVGWHVLLYLSTQFVEILPAFLEWLGWKKWRKFAVSLTIGATIFGVILSTLHQAALGGLFLLAPSKVHPLWYSPFIPLFYFVSAIAAGISMVIFVDFLIRKFHKGKREGSEEQYNNIILGLGKGASITLLSYFFIKIIDLAYSNTWSLIPTSYGNWYLVEMIGFVFVPCFLYAVGVRDKNVRLIQITSVITILGIILNRANLSIITFNYQFPIDKRYIPNWMEFAISFAIITVGIVVFKWIINRVPILHKHHDYSDIH
jgi:Ni/Fe-hydrogenase subunit HybB-like protein